MSDPVDYTGDNAAVLVRQSPRRTGGPGLTPGLRITAVAL